MTFIECKVELRRTDGRTISTSTSLQVRPVVDQPINVPVAEGPWVKAKITSVKPLNIRNTVFEVTEVASASAWSTSRPALPQSAALSY
jgi:hypothetical protein